MTLTFADTHNMIAYLTKSDASEGFNQIINFLNGSLIKYALIVNPNIYVSCIKQFWTSVAVKKVNNVTRLQALVDKKRVIITEATIRDAIHLDNAEGDLSSYTTKYSSPALIQKVDKGANEVHHDDVLAVGVAVEGDVSAVDDVVPTDDARIFMDLLQNLLNTFATLTRRVENLEHDKVSQALEITKLKQRVKKLEKRNKASKLHRLKKGRMIADMDADVDVTLKDDVKYVQDAEMEENIKPAELQEVVEVVTTAKLITEVVTADSTTIIAAAPQLTTAVAPTLTTALSATRRRKGVVIRDPEETAKPSIIIHTKAKSKDKGKGILVEEPKPLKKQAQIEQDEAYQKEDNAVKRYQALKRKPQTKAQAKKNMMIYLGNVVGFKMDYFKGMTYDDIRPIFKKHFNSNVAFLQKTKEQMDEEDSKAIKRLSKSQEDKAAKKQKLDEEVEELRKPLMIVPNKDDDVYTEATPLALKVPVVDYEIYTETNKPYYKIKRVDGSHQLYLSFLSMLRKFDREELAMFEKPERRYPLTRFILDQMVNNVRLEVEEESEVSLELLSFEVNAAEDFKKNMLSDYCCQAKLMLLINAAKLN
uniref:Xylulose kinase-1 n=1 Tax=Tanacetum cinerariifolium TaxID=118510 RepID=A0A6L2K452_TANCI|nr:xylulose kinase-1 [Tanacetum cinerariifolium]